MSDEIQKTMDEVLDDLFSDSKSNIEQIVELPSKGLGYKDQKSKVTIRTMTFDDEMALSESTPDQDVVNLMISRCVKGVDPDTLYSPDKIFLLFKIRELSYGTSVKLSGPCSNCQSVNNLDVDLSKLEVKYVDDTFTDPKEVFLPDLKKNIYVRIPRSSDSEYLINKKRILDNLWRFVEKIHTYSDPQVISTSIERLSSRDVRIILENLLDDDFGLQNRAKYVCVDCRKENILEVPVSQAFFTVS